MKIILTERELQDAIADYAEKRIGQRTATVTIVSVEGAKISVAHVEAETGPTHQGPG